MASGKGGSPASAGTKDTRVDRPEEGLPGVATVSNPTANPPTRATFDSGLSTGLKKAKSVAQIDTSGTSGNQPGDDTKRSQPAAW